VTYEWRIENPSIAVTAGAMTFTATVRARVGTQTTSETRTVPASMAWDPTGRRLRLVVGAFVVPLRLGSTTVASVDVARLHAFELPVQPEPFRLPLPDGGARDVQPRVVAASVAYQPGKAVLDLGLGF
jgi:hypothetical protein